MLIPIRIILSVLIALLVAACAEQTTERAAAARFDASDQHLDGWVRIEPETSFIEARWTITLDQPETSQITYWLYAGLENVTVSGPGVASYQVSAEAAPDDIQAIIIDLSEPDGGARRFEIAYSGVLFPEPMASQINSISPDLIELTVDSYWKPRDARGDQRLTAEVMVEIEGDWTPVSSGRPEPRPGGFAFVFERPNWNVPITLLGEHRSLDAGRYRILDRREEVHDLQPLAEAAGFCTEFLDSRFGERERLPQASIVIHRRPDVGYARGTMISLPDMGRDFTVGHFRVICHELAHFWSLNGNPRTVENWLNESFAEYIAILAIRERYGEAAFEAEIERLEQRLERRLDDRGALPAIWTPEDASRRPHGVTYIKGPLALAALEARIGRDAFAEFLRRAMVERIATTPDLLEALEDVAGADHRAWFESRLIQES